MMRTRALLGLVLLAACSAGRGASPSPSDLTLSVAADVTAAGETVTLVLRNGSDAAAGYNLCTSALERRTDRDWEPLSPNRVCTMELRTLEPATETSYEFELPAVMIPGQYRFVTTVENMATGVRSSVWSDPFTVEL